MAWKSVGLKFEHDQLCRRTAACTPEYQTCAAAAELKAPAEQLSGGQA